MKNTIRCFLICFSLLIAVVISACTTPEEEEDIELATPIITQVNETTISWTSVEHAVAYDLEVNGVASSHTATQYQVNSYGTYVFRVRAKAAEDSNYLNSPWSEQFTLEYPEPQAELPKAVAPIIDKQTYASIYWLPVSGAAGYRVYVNNEAVSPDLTSAQTSYSIASMAYGEYTLRVQTLPSDDENFSPSDLSNEIRLELIDPATYGDRLSILISGKPFIIAGESATYLQSIVDSEDADISFLNNAVNWSITSGGEFATVNSSGLVETTATGTVVLKATLQSHATVVGEFEIEIVERPTLSVLLSQYDKQAATNNATVTAGQAGTLYYINLEDAPENLESFLSLSLMQAVVTSGENTVNINIGNPLGNTVDIYFVLGYEAGGYTIGYSEIFAATDIEMLVGTVEVSNASELIAALTNNEEYILLTADIELTGVWTQIMTVFTGTLDGDGHTIKNLVVEGANTGMFRTLGDGATIKNIIFEDAQARNFSGANNGIIASTVSAGATVTFENMAMVNAESISSVDGSGRSTHAALIAVFNNASDTTLSIRLTNVYIQYTHHITRTTDTANIGGLFGTFTSDSLEGIILEGVYLDVKINGVNGRANNAGAMLGQGRGHVTSNSTVIKFEYISPTSGPNGIDVGFISSGAFTPTFGGTNNIFVTASSTLKGTWDVSDYTQTTMLLLLENDKLTELAADPNTMWTFAEGTLSILVAGNSYAVDPGVMLDQVVLLKTDLIVSWQPIENATGYQVYIDGEAYGLVQTSTEINLSVLDAGTYDVQVQAIGNQVNFASGLLSDAVEVTIEPFERLEQPELEVVDNVVSWAENNDAEGFRVFINGVSLETIVTENSIDLTEYLSKGINEIQVQAVANPATHLDSFLSEAISIILVEEVSNASELIAALASNEEYILLTADIELTGVWAQIATTFTGTLDGNGFSIKNLVVEGANTGMFKTLGNGATIKNIVFEDAQARNFSGANNGIIANTVSAGAIVTFENVALVNAQSISSVEGSGRSTHAALIAVFNNASDTTLSIRLTNVYIQYTHHITRTTDTANIGSLFGTFASNSPEGIVLNSVYLDVKINGVNGRANNAGAIFGQGRGHLTLNSTVIKFEYISPTTGPRGVDGGFIMSGSFTPTFQGTNNVFIATDSEPLVGTWDEASYVYFETVSLVELEDVSVLNESVYWTIALENFYLTINGTEYNVL